MQRRTIKHDERTRGTASAVLAAFLFVVIVVGDIFGSATLVAGGSTGKADFLTAAKGRQREGLAQSHPSPMQEFARRKLAGDSFAADMLAAGQQVARELPTSGCGRILGLEAISVVGKGGGGGSLHLRL